MHEDNSYVFVENSAFTDNQATLGGAIYSLSGELYVKLSSFLRNSASSMGGAWYAQSGSATITGRFQGNYAGTTGGAVRIKDAFVTFHNSLFAGNLSQTGSAISTDNATLNVKNSTIASNRGTDASHSQAVRITNATKSVFYNTIIRGNTGGVELINGDYRTFLYCLIQEENTFGLGNLPGYIDPGFIDAPAPNFNTPITTGDFRVGSWGQAINKGNIGTTDMTWMNTDLYGGPRFLGGQVDMGAYEYDDTCPSTLYVDSTIAASGNGNSWGTAFKTLSEALSAASCTNVDQILIAKGTYFPTGTQSGTDRDASFVIPKNKLKIIGGYPTGGGTRNRIANPTILSGDIGAAGDHSDNSHHVVTIAGLNASADSLVIDGVSVIYGNANGSGTFTYRGQNVDRQRGGGINLTANNGNDKILFRNAKLLGNQAGNGAAIATYQTSPTLLNSLIAGNLASGNGSALYADGSAVRALHTTIASNKCGVGTADLWNGSSFNLTNSIVSGNSADMSWDGTSSVNLAHSMAQGITGTANGNIDGSLAAEFISDPGFNTAPFITGNFGLSVESLAINAGDNAALPAYLTTDLAGNVRLQETNVDMGAFEQAYPCFYTTLYVDGSVAQSGKGGSWTKAFKTLGEALAKADECVSVSQILVAEGTYYPGGEQSGTDADATFGIYRGGLKLLGGYPAGGGTRDPALHKTTLSGAIGTTAPHDNIRHIIIIAGLAAGADSVVVDGFDIVYGYAGGFGPSIIHGQSINQQNGGGIYLTANNQSDKIAIRRIRMFGNIGNGSGLYVEQSAPVLIGNDIFANSGEAIMASGATVTLINNTLAGNNSGTATVNISASSTLNVFNTIIYNNNAGIVKDGTSNANLSHSLVQGESSTANGNIDGNTDPKFVESFPYVIAPNYRGNYSITPASPAIDKGDNSKSPAYITQDLFGNARIQGGTIDMGAYEGESLCSATVLYVDASVSASGNGSDWSQAFKTLDEAIAALATCPDINTIRVAAGTYYPGGNQSGTDRDATFAITRGNLKIEGGYPAGGGTRDIPANTTILSGDIGTANDAADNAHHIMVIAGLNAAADSVIVEGFTITDGNANGSGDFSVNSKNIARSYGGGIQVYGNENSGKIRISDCIFTDNQSLDGGGAIASSFNQLTMVRNAFTGNSGSYGAAIFNTSGAVVIANSSFSSNNGSFGGAVYNYASASQIFGNTFELNQASSGGALHTSQAPAAKISDNTFTNNQASVFGGAVYNSSSAVFQNNSFKSNKATVYAGAFYNNNNASPIITGCTFESNQGPSGGAVYNASGASPKIVNSVFKGNSGEMGGAIFNQSASPSISGVAFTGNKASFFGGGIGNQSASPVIVNATFGGNSAAGGSAIFSQFSSTTQIRNSVVFGNSSGIENDGTGTQTVSFSLVQGMGGGSDGNLDGATDPLFVSAQDPTTAPSALGDYRTGDGSPVINAGFNDLVPAYLGSDLDSLPRIGTLRVDLGAYEHDCPLVLAANEQEADRYLHTGQNFIFDACSLLAGIAPAGVQPVSGTVTARAWVRANIVSHGVGRFVRRHYDLTPSTGADNATGDITLYFTPADFQHYNTHFGNSGNAVLPVIDGDDISKLKVVQYHGAGNANGDPASYGEHMIITPTAVVFNPVFQLWEVRFPVTGFSGFFISGQSEDALPVTLIAFDAKKQENDVKLNWQTSEETASDYFEVQRSTDARSFHAIGKVNAKGESNEKQSYAFTDAGAANSSAVNLYYRLKMIDTDGSFAYSKVVSVRPDNAQNISIYPNPLVNDKKLSVEMPYTKYLSADLLDTRGNKLKSVTAKSGGKLEMQLSKLPAGTYVLRITADGVVVVRKVVVQ
ncbi:Por secretion system C-terminal sorting domain-containing protein [Dyadobacter soli]|uniref:Por secretion system C-terminal sorting domain-containing protein n=1 Tax=Dyadobacter soli TaxID=659014 RepID=A0A1G6VBR4_9BACT|nr:choice-of-anchor Q domain-containing protein [Dyadobacter soli]SDD50285.1 Por secretion system C-terminal sorting domain-containing protein [Dyadobacter soli]